MYICPNVVTTLSASEEKENIKSQTIKFAAAVLNYLCNTQYPKLQQW